MVTNPNNFPPQALWQVHQVLGRTQHEPQHKNNENADIHHEWACITKTECFTSGTGSSKACLRPGITEDKYGLRS